MLAREGGLVPFFFLLTLVLFLFYDAQSHSRWYFVNQNEPFSVGVQGSVVLDISRVTPEMPMDFQSYTWRCLETL